MDQAIKAAGVLIERNNKILLVQEASEMAYGLWCVPMGRLDAGESYEQAAVREAREETGYEVKIIKFCSQVAVPKGQFKGLRSDSDKIFELRFFEVKIVGGELLAAADQLAATWLTREKIKQLPLRGEWMKGLLGL